MLLILFIAGGAAAAVILYNSIRESRPDAASQAARRTQQLAAVTLCLARAVEGIVEALAAGIRPAVAASGPQWRSDRLIDRDWVSVVMRKSPLMAI